MDKARLRSLSKQYFQNNGIFAIIIFIFAAILIASISLLDLVLNDILILLIFVPLLVLPILFSFMFMIIHKSEVDKISLGIFFQGFKFYFNEHFSSTFSFWRTALTTLLLYIGISLVSLLAINLPLYYTNQFNCQYIIDGITDIIYSNPSIDVLEQFIKDNWYGVNLLAIVTSALPLSICTFYVVYAFGKNSISIFLRSDMQKYQGKYLHILNGEFLRANSKKFFAADLYLNWPSYVAFIGAFCLGGFLGSLYELSSVCTFTFGLALALLIYFGIFGSIRFANKQALYEYFKLDYIKFDVDFQTNLIKRFTDKVVLNLPNKNEEEENKKDSNES